jgi:hypothetical protein
MDVFDFDDDVDLQSPPSSPQPIKKTVKQAVATPAVPPPAVPRPVAQDEPPTSSSQASNSTTTSAAATTTNPLKGGRTRHARRRALQKQQLDQQQQQKQEPLRQQQNNRQENNGCSPSKHVRLGQGRKSKDQSSDEESDGEQDDDNDEDWSAAPQNGKVSVLSNRTVSRNGTIGESKRKRGRKEAPTKKTKGHNRLFPRNKRQQQPPHSSSSLDLFDDDFATPSSFSTSTTAKSTRSLSEQLKQKLQQHERQQQKLCPEPTVAVVSRKVRGAGRDVYATQDAGANQMLHDDLHYQCSIVVACPANQIPTKSGLVESVSELAVLLSNTKTRKILWHNNNHVENDEETTISAVLDVLSHTTSALAGKASAAAAQKQRFHSLSKQLQPAKTKDRQQRLLLSMAPPPNQQQHQGKYHHNNIVEYYYTGLLLDSLAAIVSFLTWDVTVSNKASAFYHNPRGARALRKTILNHEGAIMSFLYIIRHSDPMVSSILEPQIVSSLLSQNHTTADEESSLKGSRLQPRVVAPSEDHSKVQHHPHPGSQQTTSDMSSLQAQPSPSNSATSKSLATTYSNAGTEGSREDPTVAGRRKRKRRRGGGGTGALETIAEEGSQSLPFPGNENNNGGNNSGTMTPPRSPPRVVFRNNNIDTSDARTKFSFTSEDAMSPSRTPPRRGRGYCSNGGSPGSIQGGDGDGSSMVSCDSALLKIHDRLGTARARFVLPSSSVSNSKGNNLNKHDCQDHRELPMSFGGKDPAGSASSIALAALRRLIAGKEEGDAQSCLDDAAEDERFSSDHKKIHDDDFSPNFDDDDNEEEEKEEKQKKPAAARTSKQQQDEEDLLQSNPLFQTNRMLGDSGAIPMLAQGMAETLAAVLEEIHRDAPCHACLQHLHDKFQGLAAVVDGACLLHDDNRTDLCSATVTTGTGEEYDENDSGGGEGGVLIGSLILFLKAWMHQKSIVRSANVGSNGNKTSKLLGDMGLSVLRTLTSLTHDNTLAAEQLAVVYDEKDDNPQENGCNELRYWSGVQVIGNVLHRASHTFCENHDNKVVYDTRIFCLNTLANVVGDEPNGDIRRLLDGMVLPCSSKKGGVHFLSWLTQWLVGQTDSFRDAIMKGSFGGAGSNNDESHSRHSDRELEKHEHEQLVTAGNGCVLLACLLMDAPSSSSRSGKNSSDVESVTRHIRELILAQMPLDERSGLPSGTTFIQNTLRAFSNFLYYSVGDLSVAVVAPVRNLIAELEKIHVEVEVAP